MEKSVTFSNLRAVFTKDFDTSSKMVSNDKRRTHTSNSKSARVSRRLKSLKVKSLQYSGAGKEPKWKADITLNYFDET